MKKFLFLFAIAFILFSLPLAAYATCSKSGTVVRVTARDDVYSSNHHIYIRTSALSSVYYSVWTRDDNMAEIASEALTSQTRVSIRGDATTCPSSSTGGSMGRLQYIVVNPQRSRGVQAFFLLGQLAQKGSNAICNFSTCIGKTKFL